jgi:endonuclease YncB( thermonuclease family)
MTRRLVQLGLVLTILVPGIVLAQKACATARVTRIVRVVDGDTFDAEVAVRWLQITLTVRERVRVLGVDAWELRDGERGQSARAFTARWLADAEGVSIRACDRDSFGRVLAEVTNARGERLAEALITGGHGIRR